MAKARPSRWPAVLVAAAGLAFAGYFLFFRGRAETPPVAGPGGPQLVEQLPAPDNDPGPPPSGSAVSGSALPAVEAAPRVATPQQAPSPAPAAPRQDDRLKGLVDAGRLHEARALAAQSFAAASDDASRAALAEQCIALNRKLLRDRTNDRDLEILTVAHGESPIHVARRTRGFHGEPGLLFLLNGLHPKAPVRAGVQLLATKGAWSIFVDKSLFKLWLCYEGAPFKGYTVCVGRDDKTPAVAWTVDLKNPKPAWTAPPDWLEQEKMKNPIPYGHPKNPLGEYWVGLAAPGYTGFGIHGTNEPDTMGTKASNGCVRMLNTEVVELASCVWKGMTVVTAE